MSTSKERLFQKKYALLARLKKNLTDLNHKILFHSVEECGIWIDQNQKIVSILSKLDQRIKNTLSDIPKDPELYKILEECLELQKSFETRWNQLTKSFKIELTELEVKRQLRQSLRTRFEF